VDRVENIHCAPAWGLAAIIEPIKKTATDNPLTNCLRANSLVHADITLPPIRLFSEEVGLTPKSFCRIRRFQRAVSLLHRAQVVDWADTALACGYCDQSHMIHDFRDFAAGLSPAQYLSRRSALMKHVPQ
jgi:methylphosphotriester-DNA--protein-cysteine methyltransferase